MPNNYVVELYGNVDVSGLGGNEYQLKAYARENRNVFSLDLNVPGELLSVTVLGREFHVAGAEQRKARLAKAMYWRTVRTVE